MNYKTILGAALLAGIFASSAFADFYIVREQNAKECTIVREKPTVQTTTVIGNKVYHTEEEARGELTKVCVNR